MYQFTEMMGNMEIRGKRTYRWRGFAAGLLAGWLPAWGITHWLGWGGWAFAGVWALFVPVGYFIGNLVKK